MLGQQAVPLDWAGNVPPCSRVCGKPEEAAIIFRVAYHHHRRVACHYDQAIHQHPSYAAALMFGLLMSAFSRTTGLNTVTGFGISPATSVTCFGLANVYISMNWT